jgi:hypothetical protein
MQWAHEPPQVMTDVTRQAVTERPPAFTPAERARLRVLRDWHLGERTRFTARELAHLHFLRWLHQTGRVMP